MDIKTCLVWLEHEDVNKLDGFIQECQTNGVNVKIIEGFERFFNIDILSADFNLFSQYLLGLDIKFSETFIITDSLYPVKLSRGSGIKGILSVIKDDNTAAFACGADLACRFPGDISFDDVRCVFDFKPPLLDDAWESKKIDLQNRGNVKFNPKRFMNADMVFNSDKPVAFFFDYDGTLTPIVERPEWAKISADMRDKIKKISDRHKVAVVSGRMREDVERLLKIDNIFYAGSHGFDISGKNFSFILPQAKKLLPVIASITADLKDELAGIDGIIIEEKKFSVAIHYRLVDKQYFPVITEIVSKMVRSFEDLRMMRGKMVFEILPKFDWNKGKAVQSIMSKLGINWDDYNVVYFGDDTTDEDAFRVMSGRGFGFLVS
ncbi:MAG: trehalose-phosphatase, partial [Candidatus Omnitrophica bacterium]|nr:trehalose-phosphatase [Candidatus Omnitrophota bacterium]